jgi:hypothetical protein
MQRLYHVDTGITIGVISRDALDQLVLESALGDRSDIDIAWDDQDPSAPPPQGPYR